jgi:hypothetical protein
MNTDSKPTGIEAKAAPTSKARKARANQSRPATNAERLVCRYCGSNDLAPSFRKRRDARCRACFRKRYGSSAPSRKAARTRKKAAK